MSHHATAEVLSAYLDEELSTPELLALEAHLADCDACQVRLAGLQRVVRDLQRLERASPPPALGIQVQRRVAREERPQGLVERFERSLERLPSLEPSLLNGFALIIAFAVILLLFAQGVERQRHSSVPVVLFPDDEAIEEVEAGGGESTAGLSAVQSKPTADPDRNQELSGGAREIGGHRFELFDNLWLQQGVAPDAAATQMEASTNEGRQILAGFPELEELLASGDRVRLVWSEQLVELYREVEDSQ